MRASLIALCVALALTNAHQENQDVVELVDEAISKPSFTGMAIKAAAANDRMTPGDGTQTGRSGPTEKISPPPGSRPMPNFPGTPYGKPGYKESHDWESDIDYFTPLIFNAKIYASMYGVKGTEEAIKKDWLDVAMKADAKYPDCRQGTLTFSPNKYYRANPDIADVTGGLCRKIITSFLKDGLFEGRPTEDGVAEKRYLQRLAKDKLLAMKGNVASKVFSNPNKRGQTTWALRRNRGQPFKSFPSRQEYTITWWQKTQSLMRPWGSVLHYGHNNGERAPGIWMYPSNRPRLHFRVGQSNSRNWGCDPGTAIGNNKQHWYFVALVVGKKDPKCTGTSCHAKATVYYDGKKVHECLSSGYTLTFNEEQTGLNPMRRLYTADPWFVAARQQMKDLTHYPGAPISGAIISAEHDIARGDLQ
jgi:hypothetical protein